MEIEIEITADDWKKYHAFVQKRLQKQASRAGSVRENVLVFGGIIAVFSALMMNLQHFDIRTAALVAVFFITVFGLTLRQMHRMQSCMAPDPRGPFIGRHRLVFDLMGIHAEGRGYHSFHGWLIVKSVERGNGLIMIFMDTLMACILPEKSLDDPDAAFEAITALFRGSRGRIEAPGLAEIEL